MNQKELLKKMLPGFLPLVVFILADEIWGTQIGLLVAIAFGIATLIYNWIKERRFDKFTFFDTLMIVLLGGVSLWLDNDVFFKLKPALIGVLICAILGISAFTPRNFILGLSKRYMGNMELNEAQNQQFQKSLKTMFFIFLLYTLLVFYSVWFMSKEAWVFISGGLFYILFGAYALFEFSKRWLQNRKYRNEEWLPLVNEKGEIVGKAPRSECHKNKQLLHPVVHLHVFNSNGEWFLQKRPMNKLIQPGKWDTAVGGHLAFGEALETALKREAFEEIGIRSFEPQFIAKYKWESDIESELVYSFVTTYHGEIEVNNQEVDEGKFWPVSEIKSKLGKAIFTPNFEVEFDLVTQILNRGKKKTAQ